MPDVKENTWKKHLTKKFYVSDSIDKEKISAKLEN
jgi:hypothetical protein